ncbi:calmin isoform X2 [Engraulis encrasicolus]|uniref:calmin isoform X2 n=1 Tax=Engraulis encrasicolus TaxID=184585 RepID=UPI002FCEA027
MAGHEWEDWFEREELIGQISDIRVQNLQVEREMVQKRTFTRWINLHLEKCNPPLEVHDLFRDIQDGRILMALLEELSGCKLLHGFKPSSHRIFRLNNIAKVLSFLEQRNVKLVSIDATDVADGNSSIVLGLIWNIILFFQIKELTGNIKSQFPSSSSLSSLPTSSDSDTSYSTTSLSSSTTPSEERRSSVAARDHGKAIKTLLHWVQRRTRRFGVAVDDFGKSWTSGLAFLAVIKSVDPSLVDMRRALLRTPRENLEEAFRTAHYSLGIPRLLEPEDVTISPPDHQVIMTYVAQFLEHFPSLDEDDVCDVVDRSGSKVSVRLNDSAAHNGVKRTHETSSSSTLSLSSSSSYVVKREWVKPPPKIFISSAPGAPSNHKGALATPSVPPSATPSLPPSTSSTDDRPSPTIPEQPDSTTKDPSACTPSPSSPQPSYVDSLISSPDSWCEVAGEGDGEGGILHNIPESCSDGSLNDADLVCDVKERVMLDDGNKPRVPDKGLCLEIGKGLDDGLDSDLFIDEGNYSLCSLDSLQAKTPVLEEEEEEEEEEEKESKHTLSAQEDGRMPKLSGMENGSVVGTEGSLQTETVKDSQADTPDGGCESGYFPEDKDSPPSLVEDDSASASASASSEQQTVKEIKAKNDSTRSDNTGDPAADRLQSSIAEQTGSAATSAITTDSDQVTDRITDTNERTVGPLPSVSGNRNLLACSESDTPSKDALLLLLPAATADPLEEEEEEVAAQEGDIHYAENVDVESMEDSDSCDVERFSVHSADSEVIRGDLREEETTGQEEDEDEGEEEDSSEGSDEGEIRVRPDPSWEDSESSGVNEVAKLGSKKLPEAEAKVGDEGSVEVTDGKMEVDSCEGDGIGMGNVTMRSEQSTMEEESSGWSSGQEESSEVDMGPDITDIKTDATNSSSEDGHVGKHVLAWNFQAPKCLPEDQLSCTGSLSGMANLTASECDGTESSSDYYVTGEAHSTSEDMANGAECKTEDPLTGVMVEPMSAETRQTGTASESRHEPVNTEIDADERRQDGASQETQRESSPCKGSATLGDKIKADRAEEEEDAEEDSPVSVIPLDLVYYPHYDVPMGEVMDEDALEEPGADQMGSGSAEGGWSRDLIGSDSEEEDYGSARLSLSVAALQPAPVQDRLPGPDTDSSDGEDLCDNCANQKDTANGDGEASDSPSEPQEPCASEPAEGSSEESAWGAGGSHLEAAGAGAGAGAGGSGSLIKGDGEWTGARVNSSAAVRDSALGDSSEFSFADLRASTETTVSSHLENGNKRSSEPNAPEGVDSSLHRGESVSTKSSEACPPVELSLEEVLLLLLLWLLVYCLFVLPQMDLWSLPQLLFNLD